MICDRYIPELKKYDSILFLHQTMTSGKPLKIVQRHMAHPVSYLVHLQPQFNHPLHSMSILLCTNKKTTKKIVFISVSYAKLWHILTSLVFTRGELDSQVIQIRTHNITKRLINTKRERPLMTSDIRVGRGLQDSPQNGTLQNRKRQVDRSKMAKKRETSLMDVSFRF